jgi:hypothetical protein
MSAPPTEKNLLDVFIAKDPRERAGARSANRFTFQQSWALCHLLDLEKTESDYLIVFDYHDDVVVFNSELCPSKVWFYQVKTHKGDWTLTSLLYRNKKSKNALSILGKMFSNSFVLNEVEPTITLISNSKYKMDTVRGQKANDAAEYVCLGSVGADALSRISSNIQEEHELDFSPIFFDNMFLDSAKLSVEDHIIHSLGRLASFLEDLDPNGNYSAPAAHRAIRGTIQIKNNCEDPVTSTKDLTRKSISKSEFGKILKQIMSVTKNGTGWETIKQILVKEDVNAFKILAYENAWEKYEVERMDPTNTVLMALIDIVKENIAELQTANTLSEYVDLLSRSIFMSPKYSSLPIKISEEYLAAVILMERYEQSKY